MASVNCRISQKRKICDTESPCLFRNNTSFVLPRSRLFRMISTPAEPNPTFIRLPMRRIVLIRNVVSIPVRKGKWLEVGEGGG